MSRLSASAFVLSLLPFFTIPLQAQRDGTWLQFGMPLVQRIDRYQVHRFRLNLDQDQFAKLVVDQRGVDVVVRVHSSDGTNLGEFDSPAGADGPEIVPVVAIAAGTYSIEIEAISLVSNLTGSYQIRVAEIRHALEAELRGRRNQELLRTRALTLLRTLPGQISQLRSSHTRIRAQIRTASLLWPTDEKLAQQLTAEAISGFMEFVARSEVTGTEYDTSTTDLRVDLVDLLGEYRPEQALSFLRTTRPVVVGAGDQEIYSELTIARYMAAKNPARAFEIAKDTLAWGYSTTLVDVIDGLRESEPALAARLAREAAAKLQQDDMLTAPLSADVAIALLRRNRPSARNSAPASLTPLIPEQEFRSLFAKTLASAFAFSPDEKNRYFPQRTTALNILNSLKAITDDRGLPLGNIPAIEEKLADLSNALTVKHSFLAGAQLDLDSIAASEKFLRDVLYEGAAQRLAMDGNIGQARHIATNLITNLRARQRVLAAISKFAIEHAVDEGKLDEAVLIIRDLKGSSDRARVISQILPRVTTRQKRDAVVTFLDQSGQLLRTASRIEGDTQLSALLEVATALVRYDPQRAFDIVESFLDQFNDMASAAAILSGFGEEYYQDRELILHNNNSIAEAARQLTEALGRLAMADFDRARSDVERIRLPEVRIDAYLAMADNAINPYSRE